VVLVGEEEEAGEVPQGAAVLRKSETRPEVERRGLSLRSRRGRQSAAGKKKDCAGARSRGNGIGFSFGP
jgi:hypothetical protein